MFSEGFQNNLCVFTYCAFVSVCLEIVNFEHCGVAQVFIHAERKLQRRTHSARYRVDADAIGGNRSTRRGPYERVGKPRRVVFQCVFDKRERKFITDRHSHWIRRRDTRAYCHDNDLLFRIRHTSRTKRNQG